MRGESVRVEYRVQNEAGDWIWLESTGNDLLDDPDVGAIITLSRDVTERHRSTEELARRAAQAPLTGLLTRAELDARLPVAPAGAETAREAITVAYIDLDDCKAGHATSEERR